MDIRKFFFARQAIRQATEGDPSQLAELVRSGEDLDADVRAFLADLIEGKIKPKRGRPRVGPPYSDHSREMHALIVFDVLREDNFASYRQARTAAARFCHLTHARMDELLAARNRQQKADTLKMP